MAYNMDRWRELLPDGWRPSWLPQMPFTDYHQLNLDWIIETVKEWTERLIAFFDEDGAKDLVEDVLEEHPEWVTTVMDGAITYNKLNDSLKAYVTPEMFGAVGDGVADDTAAVRSCIFNGAKVICKNKYKLTSAIDFTNKHDITIVGGEFVREANQTFNTFTGNNAYNIKITGAYFDGNGNDRSMTYTWKDNIQGCILLANDCHKIYLEKCVIQNYNYGVFIVGAGDDADQTVLSNVRYDGKIENCTFNSCNSSIETYGKSISVNNNFIFNNTGHAIQIEPHYTGFPSTDNIIEDTSHFYAAAVGFTVENNTILNCDGICINIHPGSYGGTVTGNTCLNYGEGVRVQTNACLVNVTNNNFWYQKTQTVDGDKRPYNYTPTINMKTCGNVSGNTIKNSVVGILLYGVTVGSCKGNVIDAPSICGIATREVSECVITGNVVSNFVLNSSAWYGCRAACLFTSTNTIFSDNILETDGNSNSIFIDGASTTFGGNYTTKEQTDSSAWIGPTMFKSGGTFLNYQLTNNSGATGGIFATRTGNIVNINGANIVSTNETIASNIKAQYRPPREVNFVAIASDGTTRRGWVSTSGDLKISGVNDTKSYNFNFTYAVKL